MSVAEIVERLGMTEAEFARALAVAPSTVHHWCAGTGYPVGLAQQVLLGLRSALEAGVAPAHVAAEIRLGIGAFLYRGLIGEVRS